MSKSTIKVFILTPQLNKPNSNINTTIPINTADTTPPIANNNPLNISPILILITSS